VETYSSTRIGPSQGSPKIDCAASLRRTAIIGVAYPTRGVFDTPINRGYHMNIYE